MNQGILKMTNCRTLIVCGLMFALVACFGCGKDEPPTPVQPTGDAPPVGAEPELPEEGP